LVKSIEEVFDFIDYWNIHRHELPYETDGVVVKVNNLHYQEELGYTSKSPRGRLLINLRQNRFLHD
jgi:DNA ligase (NAD+)